MYVCSHVLVLVTSKLSDPITTMIAALIGPQRFVMVLIGKERKHSSLSDALLPAKLSKSFASGKVRGRMTSGLYETELPLMSLMDFRDYMIWVYFHPEESFSQFPCPFVYLGSFAQYWEFSFCCRGIQHCRQDDSCNRKTLDIQ